MFLQIYKKLLSKYGHQHWWPVSGQVDPFLEISVGAILTQNTNWKNVEKAISNLLTASALDWKTLLYIDEQYLGNLIKPAGFYRRKSKTIKNFVKTVSSIDKKSITRETLLNINGIGKETADSILLYGLNKPTFVIDAYTKRLFYRLDLITQNIKYDELQRIIQRKIPEDVSIYKEYHALIVEHGKTHCKTKPLCIDCPLEDICNKNGII